MQQSVNDLQSSTHSCTGFTVNICLSYGSRGDIVKACQDISQRVAAKEVSVEDITEEMFGKSLLTGGQTGMCGCVVYCGKRKCF